MCVRERKKKERRKEDVGGGMEEKRQEERRRWNDPLRVAPGPCEDFFLHTKFKYFLLECSENT